MFVDTKLAEKLFSNNSEPMPDDELFGKQNKKPKKKRQGKTGSHGQTDEKDPSFHKGIVPPETARKTSSFVEKHVF